MNDKTLQYTMLYDFFGDLLTEKQRDYFDLYHNEDLSLSEIAERAGISRQGVHDIIARAERTLMEIEQKTGIIKKWLETRTKLELISADDTAIDPIVLRYFLLEKDDMNGI